VSGFVRLTVHCGFLKIETVSACVCTIEAWCTGCAVWKNQFWADAWSGDYTEWRDIWPQGHWRAPTSRLSCACIPPLPNAL